ncbi:YciI family protein [Streptomyces jumonjinensis]|uniref:YciI family protein n=1 Tax=Streptomyces jumonjinensis TaxID=1945 RepID=UPI0018865803|nr:YciI family protein [Streptomyces jumonjinensis]
MQYALIYFYDPAEAGPGGDEEVKEWINLDNELTEAGIKVHEAGFHPGTEGKTVTVRDGGAAVEDGVAAGSTVAGYYVLDVPDEHTAVSWAQRIPAARYGRVEIRQVTVF